MRRYFPILIIFLLFWSYGMAQVKNSVPFTLSEEPKNLSTLYLHPPSELLRIDESSKSALPQIIGKVYDTTFDVMKLARYDEVEEGRIYNLRIQINGVEGLILYFSAFFLPLDGFLCITGKEIDNSYTFSYFNNPQGGSYSIPMTHGEYVTLRVFIPYDYSAEPHIILSGIGIIPKAEKGYGGSGSCEVNVNCNEGLQWTNQRDAIVRILVRNVNSIYWCTGTLINNARKDKTPYILTANHCGRGATKENLNQWQFFFNYEASDCSQPAAEPELRLSVGGTKKAASDISTTNLGSDFYLLTLNEGIPENVNAFFSGWSRLDQPSASGVCIHHPQGDIKKISTFTTPTISSSWETMSNSHWKVSWSATENGHGVTEGGSSGCPLFNSNGLLMGTLTGGQSSCDSSNLNQPDYFGKFSAHWDLNGQADTLKLQPFLDPDQIGMTTLEGMTLGIEQTIDILNLSVFPNPARQNISLQLPTNFSKSKIKVEIFHASGQKVLETALNGTSAVSIQISHLRSGVYFIRISSEEKNAISKFIKY